jgi:hypothetical protein
LEKEDKIDLRVLETSQNPMAKVDQASHQEMERKKVLVLKGNQALETSHQEMERKKVLVLKGNQVLLKKINQNQMVLQTIQSILKENPQKIHLQTQRNKVLALKERKNLKAEITDLKTLALKNTVKKELDSKIF